jgi:integrase
MPRRCFGRLQKASLPRMWFNKAFQGWAEIPQRWQQRSALAMQKLRLTASRDPSQKLINKYLSKKSNAEQSDCEGPIGSRGKSAARAVVLAEPPITTVATERETTQQDVKGKIVEFAWYLQKQGYKSAKNKVNMIKRLAALGANLGDPESVKEILAKHNEWTDSYKMLLTYAYEAFLKMQGKTWEKPRYKQENALPFIPTEEELDQLIAGTGKKVGTFLQGLKDTGCDPGELAKLRWIDINWEAGTVNIRPVKGHSPRLLKVSDEFLRRVSTLPRKGEYVFNYESLKSGFADAKKRLACKLENPRLLAVSFTTFRHWKGTMEYHKTRDLLHVKKLLGHKKVETTMIYVNLEQAVFTSKNDEYYVAVAHNIEEACKLVEAGFEYVTGEYAEGGKIFRKRK